jgi:hypothetical protein
MIDFVRPAHLSHGHNLGTQKDFYRFFEVPTIRAQVSHDVMERRKARRRCWMLFDYMRKEHIMLRRSNTILIKQLPHPLYEIILTVRFSAVQHRVYLALLEWHSLQAKDAASGGSSSSLRVLDIVQFVSMLLCHPQVVRKHCHDLPTTIATSTSGGEEAMTDIDGVVSSVSASASAAFKRSFIDDVLPTSTPFDMLAQHSAKMVLLLQIVLQSKAVGDRVLIFSKWVHTLDFIENLFEQHNRAFEATLSEDDMLLRAPEKIKWGRFDGSTPQSERQALIQPFGAPDATSDYHQAIPDVLIISTLCGEGINLCRANRVILMDVSWNPNHDQQCAHRVYRYGQTKPCFVYRFVVSASMEEKMLLKQIRKEELSKWSLERRHVSRNVAIAQSAAEFGPEPTTAKEAKEAAAASDPSHVKRFFDPPPPMATLLAERTSVRLSSAILADRVTSNILGAYSNPPNKKLSADSSPGAVDEPNTWILSAFEQHSLIEDDTSTMSLYGDEEAAAASEPASTALPSARVASPTLTPAPTPLAPPAYWFGKVPAGLTLAPSKHGPVPTAAAAPVSTPPPAAATVAAPSMFRAPAPVVAQPKPTPAVAASAFRSPENGKAAANFLKPKETPQTKAPSPSRPPPAPVAAAASSPVASSTNRVPIPSRTGASAAVEPAAAAAAASASASAVARASALERELAQAKDKFAHLSEARKQRKQTEDTILFMQQQKEEKARLQKRVEELQRNKALREAQAARAASASSHRHDSSHSSHHSSRPSSSSSYRPSSSHPHLSSSSSHRDSSRDRDRDRDRDRSHHSSSSHSRERERSESSSRKSAPRAAEQKEYRHPSSHSYPSHSSHHSHAHPSSRPSRWSPLPGESGGSNSTAGHSSPASSRSYHAPVAGATPAAAAPSSSFQSSREFDRRPIPPRSST